MPAKIPIFIRCPVLKDYCSAEEFERVKNFSCNNNTEIMHLECSKCHFKFDITPCVFLRRFDKKRICLNCQKLHSHNYIPISVKFKRLKEFCSEEEFERVKDFPCQDTDNLIHLKCPDCSYEFDRTPDYLYQSFKWDYVCPKCAGKVVNEFNNIRAMNPKIADEFDAADNKDKNGNKLWAKDVLCNSSNKLYDWKCLECGFVITTTIPDKMQGRGCSACGKKITHLAAGNSLRDKNSRLADEFDAADNRDLDGNKIYASSIIYNASNKDYKWKCLVCGCEWEASLNTRIRYSTGCPECAKCFKTSYGELAIFYLFHEFDSTCKNRVFFKSINKELDVYFPELNVGIEYDGWKYHSDEKRKVKDELFDKLNIFVYHIVENKERKVFEPYWENERNIHVCNDPPDDLLKRVADMISLKIFGNDLGEISINSSQIYLMRGEIPFEKSLLAKCPEGVKSHKIDEKVARCISYGSKKNVDGKCPNCNSDMRMTPNNLCSHPNMFCSKCRGEKISKVKRGLLSN